MTTNKSPENGPTRPHTPADFAATRYRLGMSVNDLARALGIDRRLVERWESPASPAEPFPQAWDILEQAERRHAAAVGAALDKIEDAGEDAVTLPWWPSASAYRAAGHTDAITHTMQNATAAAVAEAAEALGYSVRFVWPDTPLIREQVARADERRQKRPRDFSD
jgi:transcriptional regulator with XRE-family HTH domain